jgi:hypothetical protein
VVTVLSDLLIRHLVVVRHQVADHAESVELIRTGQVVTGHAWNGVRMVDVPAVLDTEGGLWLAFDPERCGR